MKIELILFFRQFATLIEAGVSVYHACETLETIQTKRSMRYFIYSLKKDLETGNSLFVALLHQQQNVDSMICHLVNLAEQTGRLGSVLNQIADHYEKQLQRKKRLQQALIYPSLVLFTAICVCLILLIFVIPQFASLFTEAQLKLPLITRAIFYIAAHLKYTFLLSVLLIVFFLLICRIFKRLIRIGVTQIPIIKTFMWNLFLAKFIQALNLALSERVPLHESLEYAARAAGNDVFIPDIVSIKNRLNSGLSFYESLCEEADFPLILVQMIKVGEETGKLTPMLTKSAEFLEDQIEQTVLTLSSIFEPLIILLLGVVIGGIVISMYLPVFHLGTTI